MSHSITRIELTRDYDGNELHTFTDNIPMTPDKFDIAEGLTNHVDMAIDYLGKSAYVVEASVYPVTYANRNTWFTAEPYVNPYCSDVQEATYHLNGFTDDEVRQIAVTVLGTK